MSRRAPNAFVVLFSLPCMFAVSALSAMEKLYVRDPVPIDQDASIDPIVRETCQLDVRLPFFLYQKINDKFEVVPSATLENLSSARTLTLIIQNVQGDASSGAWFGRKGITLRGTLRENGTVIGSFNARRRSTGGALGPFTAGCEIFERCAKALAEDVAAWLQKPSMDAWIGELTDK